MAGLRERRHRETRQALVEAAFELFANADFADVTMEDIARAAGVSRSTAYRRFATKEEVVLEVPRRWLAAFDEALAALPEGTSLAEATRATCLAVAAHIDRDHETVLAAYAVLQQAPSLQSSGLATRAWLERLAEVLERFCPDPRADDAGHGDETGHAIGIVAGAYLGAIDAMMQQWAADGGTGSVTEATERLVDRLEPILPT
ncbi:MAG: TetR/AcrR family transcriptional regulator [Actinomycetota bacterium]